VIAATFLVMSAIVITRLGDEIAGHRAVLARERALREACASLVAAIDLMRDVTERQAFEREMLHRALLDSPAGQNRQSAANRFRLP
jgi:hypothetical protein